MNPPCPLCSCPLHLTPTLLLGWVLHCPRCLYYAGTHGPVAVAGVGPVADLVPRWWHVEPSPN